MPVVDDLIAGDDHVSLGHGDMLGLNSDGLAVDWASDSVAENDIPLIFLLLILGNKDAVLVTTGDSLQSLHVLDMLLVNRSVPEDDAHIVALWLSEGKNESAGEVAPHVVWLDVGEQDVRVNGESDSEAIAFPGHGVDHAGEGWDAEGTQMLTES